MTDQPEIGAGDVEIDLGGEVLVLRPTLDACMRINKIAGGMNAAANGVASLNFDIICDVIAAGLGANPTQRQKLIPEKVYMAGMINLAGPCIRFIRIVNNGGRPPVDEEDGESDRPLGEIVSPSENSTDA